MVLNLKGTRPSQITKTVKIPKTGKSNNGEKFQVLLATIKLLVPGGVC